MQEISEVVLQFIRVISDAKFLICPHRSKNPLCSHVLEHFRYGIPIRLRRYEVIANKILHGPFFPSLTARWEPTPPKNLSFRGILQSPSPPRFAASIDDRETGGSPAEPSCLTPVPSVTPAMWNLRSGAVSARQMQSVREEGSVSGRSSPAPEPAMWNLRGAVSARQMQSVREEGSVSPRLRRCSRLSRSDRGSRSRTPDPYGRIRRVRLRTPCRPVAPPSLLRCATRH